MGGQMDPEPVAAEVPRGRGAAGSAGRPCRSGSWLTVLQSVLEFRMIVGRSETAIWLQAPRRPTALAAEIAERGVGRFGIDPSLDVDSRAAAIAAGRIRSERLQ
jgi:hypothetical protein